MKILVWNCRGLGLTSTVGELKDLVRSLNPEVVLLCETKKRTPAVEKLRWSLGFSNGVAVNCNGRSGGLTLWWRGEIEVEFKPFSQYHMDIYIHEDGRKWRFSGIYGEPRTGLRDKTWSVIRYLSAQTNLPWLCAGDFNEVPLASKQLGQNVRSPAQMERFRECVECVGFKTLATQVIHSSGIIDKKMMNLCK